MRQTDVIIIGGGAAGLTAAIAAARKGASVTVLEHMERVGKKLLSTGNGRCNYTNNAMGAEYYRGSGVLLAKSLLKRYDTRAILHFFLELGIEPAERNGYFYPASGQAASVLEVLRLECAGRKVDIRTGIDLCRIEKKKFKTASGQAAENFVVTFQQEDDRQQLAGRSLILATGSKAAPVTGSDGSGYALAKQFGHRINPVYPALTGLKAEGRFLKAWAGVRVQGSAALYIQGKKTASDIGELQLTDYGVSGIPVFQISRYAAEALAKGQEVELSLCFWPERFRADTERCLRERLWSMQERTLSQALTGLLPAKLIPVLLRLAGLPPEQDCHLTERECRILAQAGADFRLTVTGTGSFVQAQVCAGGVDGSQINPQTMESFLCSGLYFAGELIDVDGMCGGYNLHFAWASGLTAGESAAERGKSICR